MSKTEKVFYTVLKHFPNNIKGLALKEKNDIMQEFILLLLLEKRRKKYENIMQKAIRNVLRIYHGIHYSKGKIKYRRFYLNEDSENY